MQRAILGMIGAAALLGCSGTAKPVAGPGGSTVAVDKAKLPYKIVRARGGGEIDEATFLAELNQASSICIGENHKNPHHHWAQLYLFDKLLAANVASQTMTALGMEMFQRPFQGVLDDYLAGKIDEKAMLTRTGYEDRWGYDWDFYSPMVNLARMQKAVILALNTERELTKRVARVGIPRLTDEERAKLPELNLEDPKHRLWWNTLMGGMAHPTKTEAPANPHETNPHEAPANPHEAPKDPHAKDPHAKDPHAKDPHAKDPHGKDPHAKPKPPEEPGPNARPDTRAEWIYTAQVLWDETMASGAVKWLKGGEKRQVVIIAGNGHCHDSAIVNRVKRRGVDGSVSVRPIIDKGDGEIAAELASPKVDYLFIMTFPQASESEPSK